MPFRFDEIPVSAKLDDTVKASLEQIKREKRKSHRKSRQHYGCLPAA